MAGCKGNEIYGSCLYEINDMRYEIYLINLFFAKQEACDYEMHFNEILGPNISFKMPRLHRTTYK